MAATDGLPMARRRPFARFDAAQQDSDQTLTSFPRLPRSARPISTSSANASAVRESSRRSVSRRRQPHQASAFFLETTDDDERVLADRDTTPPVPATNRRTTRRVVDDAMPSRRESFARQYPRVHIGTIDFPATRSVLWDRRVLADPVVVSSSQMLPRFVLPPSVARELYRRHQLAAAAGAKDAPACFVRGEAIVPTERRVRLVQVVEDKGDGESLPGGWWIPVYFMDGPNACFPKDEYVSGIKAAQLSYGDEYCEALASRLQPRLLVSSSSDHAAQLDFQIEFPFSPLLLQFSLIRNLPLLMTPLAASLARHEFGTGRDARRSGYLTLDRTRKAVPLLKVDPLVFQQPIVGVWVYGVDMEEEWDVETARTQLADPYLYFTCLNYITARSIKERAQLTKNTFLVALYPSTDTVNGRTVSPLPRFFECSISEHLRVDEYLPMELYADRKSCFAGLSRFSTDVELAPVPTSNAAWESAKRQLDIPVIPRENRAATELAASPADADASMTGVSMTRPSRDYNADEDLQSIRSRIDSARDGGQERVGNEVSASQAGPSTSRGKAEDMSGDRSHAEAAAQSDSFALSVSELSSNTHESLSESVKESQVLSPKTTTAHAGDDGDASRRQNRRAIQTGGFGVHAHDSDSYRSCCKSQQLLAIQHQQILENQQRQLQEMQEQIAQLRRLLEATTKTKEDVERSFNQPDEDENDSEEATASKQARGRDEAGNRRWSRVGSEISRLSASLHSITRAIEPRDVEEDAKSESGNSLSSLELSSISNGSSGSDDLSSLSSSLARSRLQASAVMASRARQRAAKAGDEDARGDLGDSNASFASDRSGNQDGARADENGDHPPGDTEPAVTSEGANAINAEDHETTAVGEDVDPTDGNQTVDAPPKSSVDVDPVPERSTVTRISPHSPETSSDEDDDASSTRQLARPPLLLLPDAYLKQRGPLLDHHGGCFTAPTPDLHSFCVPRIRFSLDDNDTSAVGRGSAFAGSDSDDDDDLRLIEQKYRKLMAA